MRNEAEIVAKIAENAVQLTQLRRQLHGCAELAFQERQTAQLIKQQLTDWGIDFVDEIAGTGIVGIISKGSGKGGVALRADMDALPLQEENRFAHASKNAGVMHACGHDGHCAMLLGAAQYLQQEAEFDGTVYLVFQPAEEQGGGAQQMLAQGLFEKFDIQAIFGLHNMPGIAPGVVAVGAGPVLASSSNFDITISGKGGHASAPQLCANPINAAVQVVEALNGLVSQNVSPFAAAVVTVTKISSGSSYNVVGDECHFGGTIRTFSQQILDNVAAKISDYVQHISAANGCKAQVNIAHHYPPTINPSEPALLMRAAARKVVGDEAIIEQEPVMAAEDFSFYLQQMPGCYAFLGIGNGEHRLPGHSSLPCALHGAGYDFNDAVIPVGAATLAQTALSWLAKRR